jgi:hypothetical protein
MAKLTLIKRFNASALISLLACSSSCLFGSSYTEVLSDFTLQTDNWGGGAPSTLSTINAISAGNSYLRKEINVNGGQTLQNRMVVRRPVNSSAIANDPWLGDFTAKGIQRVELNFNNWSIDEPIYLRLALSNVTNPMQSTGTWWVSTTYATFAPESGWGHASFNIIEDEMQRVGDFNGGFGLDSFVDTVSDIKGFRFIASSTGNSALGDQFSGAIGMDNVRLISAIPEPSTSAAVMGLLATLFLSSRRRS